MNITEESYQTEVLEIQNKLDEIYTQYYNVEEDDKSTRKQLRTEWKTLINRHYLLTGMNVYRKNL